MSRKRGRQEMEVESAPPQESSALDRIRNMWEFANLMQYLFLFGKAVKVDEGLAVEDVEAECLKPIHSQKLSEIGLALLKFVSSHRGLTPDLFDEQTRRQYVAKLPNRNPFGDGEEPKKFADFDVFTKIRVLYQLSQWTMIHSDRVRERMSEQKDVDQIYWRVEPIGWDTQERTYYVLDDNRLYRRTDPPPPPPPASKPKKNSKRAKAEARANKRRKLAEENAKQGEGEGEGPAPDQADDDGFGGMKWECVAITLAQYQAFLESIRRSRDENEKYLYGRCVEDVMPIIEKAEEEQQRKMAKKQKEMLNLEKLATAKRSSRIASKLERQKEEEEAAESERKRKAELVMAKKEQDRLKKLEQDRESRIVTREQRLREREMRRILQEEELAGLSEDSKRLDQGEGRMSERHLKAEIEKRKKALEELARETDWIFDCGGCGIHGENLDDGTGIIACEKCNVWQHLACLGLSKEAAEQKDFQFICSLCKRREEDKMKSAKNPIKLDFRKLGSSMSPPTEKSARIVNGEASHERKRKTSPEGSGSPSAKRIKYDGGVAVVLPATNASSSEAFPLHQDGRNGLPTASGDQNGTFTSGAQLLSSLANGGGISLDAGDPHHSVQTPVKSVGSSQINGFEVGSPTKKTSFLQEPSRITPSASSSNPTNGFFHHSFDRQQQQHQPSQQRPFTPIVGSTSQVSPHLTTPRQDVTRVGFPAGASPPSAIFAAPSTSSLGYSPTKQPSPSSSSTTPMYQSFSSTTNGVMHHHHQTSHINNNNTIIPPPPTSTPGLLSSPSKSLTSPPSSAGTAAAAAGAVTSGPPMPMPMSVPMSLPLPPAPTLSPSPTRIDLTPPNKKLMTTNNATTTAAAAAATMTMTSGSGPGASGGGGVV